MASRTVRGLLLAGCALAVLVPVSARSQAVDYGALEQMFGEPITTSVTGKPQRASEVPGDLTIITHDDIRRSGADNIPDILQFVTGVDIRRYSFGDAQVGIRGYDTALNPRLLVLVDGRQVYIDNFGYVAWNAIPVQLDEIRQIEVVRGPNSALFGFNAASGVINIVTYDPLLDNINTATARAGTQSYGGGDVVATQHFGTTAGVRVSVGGWEANDFKRRDPSADNQPPRYGSFNADGRWQVTPDILLHASGGVVDAHAARYIITSLGELQDHLEYWRFGGTAQTSAGTVDVDAYRNTGVENLAGGDSRLGVTVVHLTDLLKVDADNTIRVGFEYRNNAYTANPYVNTNTISYDNYAVNGMWNWQITPKIELTNAVRVDHLVMHYTGFLLSSPGRTLQDYNSTTLTAVSFNSGLVVHVSDADTVRLTAARGLQLPSLIDFAFQAPAAPGIAVVGSPSIQPEAVWNTELAYDRALPSLGATAEAAIFFQRNTELVAPPGSLPPVFGPTGVILSAGNIGSSDEIGLQLGLRGTTESGFRWNASYRFASISDDISAGVGASPFTRFARGTPQHTVILGAGYTHDRWEADIAGRWQSSFTDYSAGPRGSVVPLIIGNYVTLNARVGYRVTDNLTLAVTAQQFNISHLVESAGDYVDRRLLASATVRF